MFSPSWLTDGHRLSRTPLLSALLNCPAPLRLRSEVLAPLFQSRRAPSTQQGNTHTHRRGRSLPPPGCHSLCGQETRANQRSPYIRASPVIGRGWEEKLRWKFHASSSCARNSFTWSPLFPEKWFRAGKAKLLFYRWKGEVFYLQELIYLELIVMGLREKSCCAIHRWTPSASWYNSILSLDDQIHLFMTFCNVLPFKWIRYLL